MEKEDVYVTEIEWPLELHAVMLINLQHTIAIHS